jgi:hypothetical protein
MVRHEGKRKRPRQLHFYKTGIQTIPKVPNDDSLRGRESEKNQTSAKWTRANHPGSTYLIQTRAHGLCPVSHDAEHSARMQVGKIVQ